MATPGYIRTEIDVTGVDPALVQTVIDDLAWQIDEWMIADPVGGRNYILRDVATIGDYPNHRRLIIVRAYNQMFSERVLAKFWDGVAAEYEDEVPAAPSASLMDTDPAVQALIDAGWLGEWDGPVTVEDLVRTVQIVRDVDKKG